MDVIPGIPSSPGTEAPATNVSGNMILNSLIKLFEDKGINVGLSNQTQIYALDIDDEMSQLHEGVLYIPKEIGNKDLVIKNIVQSIGYFILENTTKKWDSYWTKELTVVKQGDSVPYYYIDLQALIIRNSSFDDVLKSINCPVKKLFAIHIFNYFKKNNFSFNAIKTTNIYTYGNVPEFKKFSLAPLLGAYCPARVFKSYPISLYHLVCKNLDCVSHSKVREQFQKWIVDFTNNND